jgi:hypothetical protein
MNQNESSNTKLLLYGQVRYGTGNNAAYSVASGIDVAQTRVQRNSGKVRRSKGEGATLQRSPDRFEGSYYSAA